MNLIKSKVLGVGHAVPDRVLTNDQLAKEYNIETSDEWIQQRTGIKERHFVGKGEENSDLGVRAANIALDRAKTKKSEIDLILYATLSPDHEFPGVGCFFQAKMDMPGVPVIDIRNQCSGFLYCMSVADAMIRTGQYKKVLVVGSEVHSRGLELTTKGRDVSVLFGDGAGAMVMGRAAENDESQVHSVHLHADGKFAKELWVEAPGCSLEPRISKEHVDEGKIYPKMNGKTVFMHAVKKMPEVMVEALKANGKSIDDIDLVVPHQANLRINEAVAKGLQLPEGKMFNTIQRFGNTTAATIPIGLSVAVEEGKLKPGMMIMLAAFGSGFTWGSALIRW